MFRRTTLLYGLAVLVLGASAVAMQVARSQGVFRLLKRSLPIRKPLEDANRACVHPFRVVAAQRLPAETVEELGTSEYLNWTLATSGAAPPWQATHLSVTYYTGVQDQVPHVPEECYYQGAFTQDTDRSFDVEMGKLGRRIPVRRLSFYPPPGRASGKVYVYYTICVNGDFYSERERVRLRMSDPRESHLYYSKVELVLDGVSESELAAADRQAFELLDGVIVELIESHWPEAVSEACESSNGRPAGTCPAEP